MSARSCTDVRADLSAYLDGDLDAGLADATRAHLDGCEACRSELALLRHAVGALRRLPELPPPAGILTGIRARLRPEPWYRRLLHGRQWVLGVPVGALATLLVVVGISLFQARYPELTKTVSHEPFPQSPAPATSVAVAPPAPPAPAAREAGVDRQAAPPPASPARGELRAKRTPGSADKPHDAIGEGGATAPEPSAVTGSEAGDRDRAAPALPAEQVAATGFAAVESKLTLPQIAPQAAPVAAPKDALEKEAPRREERVGAPSRTLVHEPGPSLERAAAARKADSGAALGNLELAGGKATASKRVEVVCLLYPDGETVNDLERLLRREGAVDIELVTLEPPALREAFARTRGRSGSPAEPSRGWTLTAGIKPPALARLLEVLAGRTGVRILEQPDAGTAPEDPTEALDLRVTVFR